MKFTFPFAPVAKGRARITKRGFAYTPEKTKLHEADLKLWASKLIKTPLTGPLKVDLLFCVPKPKKPQNEHPISRPDLDNFCKSVMDAGNGVIWLDDSQIVILTAQKVYAPRTPTIYLTVEQL